MITIDRVEYHKVAGDWYVKVRLNLIRVLDEDEIANIEEHCSGVR